MAENLQSEEVGPALLLRPSEKAFAFTLLLLAVYRLDLGQGSAVVYIIDLLCEDVG